MTKRLTARYCACLKLAPNQVVPIRWRRRCLCIRFCLARSKRCQDALRRRLGEFVPPARIFRTHRRMFRQTLRPENGLAFRWIAPPLVLGQHPDAEGVVRRSASKPATTVSEKSASGILVDVAELAVTAASGV